MFGRIGIWVCSAVGVSVVLWLIRQLHVQIKSRLPDGKLKRLFLRDFAIGQPSVAAEPSLDSSAWPAQQAISTNAKSPSYIRRSYEQTMRDPVFRALFYVVINVLGLPAIAGISYVVYLLLVWLGLV